MLECKFLENQFAAHYYKIVSNLMLSCSVDDNYGIRCYIDLPVSRQVLFQVCHNRDWNFELRAAPFILLSDYTPMFLSEMSQTTYAKSHIDVDFINSYKNTITQGRYGGFKFKPITLTRCQTQIYADSSIEKLAKDLVKTVNKQLRMKQLASYRNALGDIND